MAKTTARTHNESRKPGNSSEATRDPNKTQPKLIKNRKHDAAILFIHGIGNQKAGDVLEKMAVPVAGQIRRISEKHGWQVEQTQDTRLSPIVLTFRKQKRIVTIHLDECIWSNSFPRISPWNAIKWTILRLSSIIVLLLPDRADLRTLRTFMDNSGRAKLRMRAAQTMAFLRSFFRLFIFVGVPYILFRVANISLYFLRNNFMTSIFLFFLTLICAFLFREKWDFLAHVPAATSSDSKQAMAKVIKSKVLEASKLTKRPIVVAHSQGGFLAYDVFSELSSNRKNVRKWRFMGVGSGLRPIAFLSRLNDKWTMAYWWCFSAVAVAAIMVLLDSPRHAGIEELFWSSTFFTFVCAQHLLGFPLSFYQADLVVSALQLNSQTLLHKSSLLTPYLLVLFLFSVIASIVGWLAKRNSNTPLWQDQLSFPESVRSWTELSTSHDLVGRLVLAPLPKEVNQIDLSGPSNVILDHTSYFKASLLPYYVAMNAVTDAGILNQDDRTKEYEELSSLNTQINALSQRRWNATAFVIVATSIYGFAATLFSQNAPTSYFSAVLLLSALITVYSFFLRLFEIVWNQNGPLKVSSILNSDKKRGYVAKQYDKLRSVSLFDRFLGLCLAYQGLCALIAAMVIAPAAGFDDSNRAVTSLELLGNLTLLGGVSLFLGYRPWKWFYGVFGAISIYGIITTPPILTSSGSIKVGFPALVAIGIITFSAVVLRASRVLLKKIRNK